MPKLTSLDISPDFDIVVVGSGAAGLYAALCLPAHLRVGLITKDAIHTGSSNWAQGGIAAAIDPSDTPTLHLEDTLNAGVGLCDPEAVKFLVENAPAAIAHLAITLGDFVSKSGDRFELPFKRICPTNN